MADVTNPNAQILEKLDRLERRYRRLKMILTGGVALAALAITGAVSLPDVTAQGLQQDLDAQMLVIRDGAGNRRVIIGVNAQGDAGVWVMNERGQQSVTIAGNALRNPDGTTGVWINDQNGQERFVLAANARHTGFWMTERGRDDQIQMLIQRGQPHFLIRNPAGQTITRLP